MKSYILTLSFLSCLSALSKCLAWQSCQSLATRTIRTRPGEAPRWQQLGGAPPLKYSLVLCETRRKIEPENSEFSGGVLLNGESTIASLNAPINGEQHRDTERGRIPVNGATKSSQPSKGVVSGLLSRIRRNGTSGKPSSKKEMMKEIDELRKENEKLRKTLHRLELENDRLLFKDSTIVLETFEGEGKLRVLQRQQQEIEGLIRQHRRQIDGIEQLPIKRKEDEIVSLNGDLSYDIPHTSTTLDKETLWCDELEEGVCPVEPTISFGEALRDRAYWLVGLLFLQSASGIILAHNEELLAGHPVIIYFLTMLVGAGGNAGNQASVRVIRGLALGTLNERTQGQFLFREFKMAVSLSSILSLAGFLRAFVFSTPLAETVAVTCALALIVFSSICLGAVLPLVLKRNGVDPAHSSTTIQVVMDILGVLLAVVVSRFLLDSPFGHLLIVRLIGAE